MVTKQQIREDITRIIQERVLTQVLPFTSSDDTPITITAENYQTIVSSGLTEVKIYHDVLFVSAWRGKRHIIEYYVYRWVGINY